MVHTAPPRCGLRFAPEFALLLLETPEAARTGAVFKLPSLRGSKSELRSTRVGRIVSKIGASAGIRVHVNPTNPKKVKYASAHDLRRAFGERWAARIMPAQLRELMRHESIETTLRYYVGANAERTADACWEAFDRVGGAAPSPVVQNGVSGACASQIA